MAGHSSWSPGSGEEDLVLDQTDRAVSEGDGGGVAPALELDPLIQLLPEKKK